MSLPKAKPLAFAALAVAVYAAYIGALLMSGTDVRSFVVLGRTAIERGHSSAVIHVEPGARVYTRDGYDGQYYYFIAVDPLHARDYMDYPAYRYGRILYPAAARAISLGNTTVVPWALLLINLFAVGLGVWVVAAWLLRAGLTPWPALLYAVFPGTEVAVTRDLSDALSLSLVAAAAYAFHYARRSPALVSAGLFALGALTRETALAIAAVYGLQLLRERRIRTAVLFGALAAGPYIVWHIAVSFWLGSAGVPASDLPTFPLWGLITYGVPSPIFVLQMISVVVPSVLVAGVLIYAARRGPVTPELLALQVNVLIGVLLLNHASYIEIYGSARAAAGVALFSLLCLPLLARVRSPDWWPVRLTWILWTFPYLVYGMLISARWAWMIAALAWLVATQIELVRAVRRGIRALRGDAVPSATSSRGAMS